MNQNKGTSIVDRVIWLEPKTGWKLSDIKELIMYKDLFYFLVWRNIKVLYAQTILGFSWAILQPLIQIILFTIVFGKIVRVSTEGIPYMVFASAAIIPWTYMSQAMTQSSQSLIEGANLLGKVYFPRIIFPVTPVLSRLVDFVISLCIIVIIMFYYRVQLTWQLLYLPLFFVMMIILVLGFGLWSSAMAIRFRDIKHAMPFLVRTLMYTAPIVYSASTIPEKYRFFYSFNPIVGVIEGYRACLLGTPLLWQFIWPGMIMTVVIFVTGAFYFKNMEHVFVDVI
jgi:lipopolysaccharide transport system permease protein